MKEKSPLNKEDLRLRAKALLQGISIKTGDLSNESVEWLIHELQVHQTELSLQNEALREAQTELIALGDQYADLFDFAPNGYFIFDEHGLILNVNLTACRLLKMERKSLIGWPFTRFLSDKSKHDFFLHRQHVMNSTTAQVCELTLNTDANSILEVKVESVKLHEPEGEKIQIRSSMADLTEINRVQALRRTEMRFRQLVEAAAEGIILTDIKGHIKMVNTSAEKMFDYSESELIGKGIELLIPSVLDLQVPDEDYRENLIKTRQDLVGVSKKDREFPLWISRSFFKNLDQYFHTYFVTDLNEKVKIEEQLIESKENYRILFECSPVSIWEEDFSAVKKYLDRLKFSGTRNFRNYFQAHPQEVRQLAAKVKVVNVNNTTLQFFGIHTKSEVLNKKLQDWFDHDSWDVFTEQLIQLAEGKSQFSTEFIVQTPAGIPKNLLLSLVVPAQYANTLERIIVSFIDITRLKKIETALVKETQASERYLTVANSIILVLNAEGKVLLINRKGEAILGYSKDEIIGKNWFEHFIPNQKRLEVQDVHHKIISGIIQNVEFHENEILVKGGGLRTIEWHNAPVTDENGHIISVISSGVDITLRKNAEAAAIEAIHKGQEQERQRIAQELHDGLSQQLAAANMLLTSMETDIETLKPESKHAYFTLSEILCQAIQDVRNISHNLVPMALSVAGLFTTIKDLCVNIEAASKVKIRFQKSGDDQKIDQFLAVALYRITQELLNNIIKHAEATDVGVKIDQQINAITLLVKDNGKGFEVESDKIPTGGIGLKNIASRLQGLRGRMTIESSPQKGTLTEIVVPLDS